jgi:hypothetical protein
VRPGKDNQEDATSQPLSSVLRGRMMSRAIGQLGPSLVVLAGLNHDPIQTAGAIVVMYMAVPSAKALGIGLARRIEAALQLPQSNG